MKLETENYLMQKKIWPEEGRHILAQYDENSIIVYQAYRPSIGKFAIDNGYFGDGFSCSRMSWIKPNFLWMMYRSGWGKKIGQEIILAVRLKRQFFDFILSQAVPSSYKRGMYATKDDWKRAINTSLVRLQWDPDHDPYGKKVQRRAIQLGLRDGILNEYSKDAIIEIYDINTFVHEQYFKLQQGSSNLKVLDIPKETTYVPNGEISAKLGLCLQEKIS